MGVMRITAFAIAASLIVGCSSSSGSSVGPKSDAGAADVPTLHLDARVADAKGDGRGAGRDGGADAPGDTRVPDDVSVAFPAPHPAMPQEINLGGPVMTAPKFVVITFAGDTLASSIDDFADKVAASATYWSGTTAEYGVGPIGSVLHVSLNETPLASMTDADVQAWLLTKLSGPDAGTLEGGAPWPQPDGETVYMIYYPASVTITEGGGTSCNAFYGYHDDFLLSGTTYVTYSVVARCPSFPSTSAIDTVAAIASHEMIEAATDPLPTDNPAWATPDSDHTAWAAPAGGELGDLCAGFGNVFYYPADVPYLVQRTWSNKAAAASHDPCQPDGMSPYYNAAAVLPDSVTVTDSTIGTYTTKGVKIPVGGTGTVTVDLYSDAPAPPWAVQGFDLSSLFGGTQELAVTIAGQSTAMGSNGTKLTLTIKVLQEGNGGAEILWIQSGAGSTPPVWIGVVGN
jgi:hypothetical protein